MPLPTARLALMCSSRRKSSSRQSAQDRPGFRATQAEKSLVCLRVAYASSARSSKWPSGLLGAQGRTGIRVT